MYLNNRTGWWDASFLYGQTEEAVAQGRLGTAGKLHIAEDGIPTGTDGRPLVGDRANGWVGVAMLQVFFESLVHFDTSSWQPTYPRLASVLLMPWFPTFLSCILLQRPVASAQSFHGISTSVNYVYRIFFLGSTTQSQIKLQQRVLNLMTKEFSGKPGWLCQPS